jgi:hypothetical protein
MGMIISSILESRQHEHPYLCPPLHKPRERPPYQLSHITAKKEKAIKIQEHEHKPILQLSVWRCPANSPRSTAAIILRLIKL